MFLSAIESSGAKVLETGPATVSQQEVAGLSSILGGIKEVSTRASTTFGQRQAAIKWHLSIHFSVMPLIYWDSESQIKALLGAARGFDLTHPTRELPSRD
jgi:hypothetical protein